MASKNVSFLSPLWKRRLSPWEEVEREVLLGRGAGDFKGWNFKPDAPISQAELDYAHQELKGEQEAGRRRTITPATIKRRALGRRRALEGRLSVPISREELCAAQGRLEVRRGNEDLNRLVREAKREAKGKKKSFEPMVMRPKGFAKGKRATGGKRPPRG